MKIKKKERSSSLYKMQRFPSDIPNVVSTNFNREGTINKTPIIESRMTNFLKDFLFASLSPANSAPIKSVNPKSIVNNIPTI